VNTNNQITRWEGLDNRQESTWHKGNTSHVLTINRTGKQAHDKPDTVTVFIQIIKHTVGKT